MKKIILFLVLCMLLIGNAMAYEGLTVSFELKDSGTITLSTIEEDYFESENIGTYRYVFFNENGNAIKDENFYVEFWDGFEKRSSIIFSLSVKSEDVGVLEIYDDSEKQIYKEDIGELICNKDGKCTGFENYVFCPEDCSADSEDGYCNAERNAVCDPDCGDYDIDCTCGNGICDPEEKFYTGSCPQDCDDLVIREQRGSKAGLIFFIIILLLLIAAGTAAFVYFKKQPLKRQKQIIEKIKSKTKDLKEKTKEKTKIIMAKTKEKSKKAFEYSKKHYKKTINRFSKKKD
jgi:hypothetical protein